MDKIDRSTSKEEAPSSGCLCILEEEMRAGKVIHRISAHV